MTPFPALDNPASPLERFDCSWTLKVREGAHMRDLGWRKRETHFSDGATPVWNGTRKGRSLRKSFEIQDDRLLDIPLHFREGFALGEAPREFEARGPVTPFTCSIHLDGKFRFHAFYDFGDGFNPSEAAER